MISNSTPKTWLLGLPSLVKLKRPIYSFDVVPYRPLEGVNMKAKPCPVIMFLMGATEKMKEVAKGRRVEELGDLVGTFRG
jgi:hypothetical protein